MDVKGGVLLSCFMHLLVVINHLYDLYLLQCLSKVINYTGSKTQDWVP